LAIESVAEGSAAKEFAAESSAKVTAGVLAKETNFDGLERVAWHPANGIMAHKQAAMMLAD
jgi:hypothetical protein